MTRARLAALRTHLCAGRVVASSSLSLLLGGLALAPGVANAQAECGAPNPAGQVSCPPATYPNGITYNTPNPLTVTLLQNGSAAVTTTTGGVQITTLGLGLTTLNRGLSGPAGGPGPTLVNGAGAGVSVLSRGGDALVDLRDPGAGSPFTVRGSQDGVSAIAGGTGGATVLLGAGTVTAVTGSGVVASAPGAVTVDTGTAAISAAVDGVNVLQLGATGAISVTTGGPITGFGTQNGDAGILIGASNTANTDPITVNVNGAISQETGGVRVISSGSRDVSVTTGTGGSIVAAQDGVNLATAGTGALTVVTNANIVGDSNSGTVGNAITLQGDAGAIRVDTAAGTNLSTNLGPFVITAGTNSGDISITNRATLSGVNSTGISAASASGSIAIDSQGTIGTPTLYTRTGIAASTAGAGTLTLRSSADIFASSAVAVSATNGGSGATLVNIASGTVTAALGDGLDVSVRTGTGVVNIGGAISAGAAYGISGSSLGGDLTVNVQAGGSVAASTGVLLQGTANLVVNNAGTISGLTGGRAVALAPLTQTPAVLNNLAGGVITGQGETLFDPTIILASAAAITIQNAGTILARAPDALGVFFGISGPGVGVLNNAAGGSITGRLYAGDGGVAFTNAGTWTTNGLSTFGTAGIAGRTFVNSGLVHAGSTSSAATQVSTTTFTGIGATQNSGTFSLVNGYAGDTLNLTGTYAGSGSARLLLDIGSNPAGSVADTLHVAGVTTGTTVVALSPVGSIGFTSGTLLVQAATGSSGTAFTLDPGSVNLGLTRNAIVYNPTNGGYFLVSAPNAAAAETAQFADIRHALWHVTADVWSTHLAQLRDTQGPEGRGVETGLYSWGGVVGGGRSSDVTQTVALGGASFDFDQGFDQSYVGAQVGIELIEQLFHGAAVLGATAGYVDSHVGFSFTGDDVDLHTFNIGVYASYDTPLFFVNGLLKFDLGSQDIKSGYGGFDRSLDTRQFGMTVEAGHRFAMNGWFLEPVVGASYVRGYLAGGDTTSGPGGDERQNTLNLFGATLLFDDDNSIRGRATLRAGREPMRVAGVTLRPYAEIGAEGEFAGGDKVTFIFPGTAFSVPAAHTPAVGLAKIGAEMQVSERLWITAQGEGRFGDGTSGGGAIVSAVYHW